MSCYFAFEDRITYTVTEHCKCTVAETKSKSEFYECVDIMIHES